MHRSTLPRNVSLFLACGAWVFLLVCLGSFHPTDWPSHAVEPYPPTQNLCGSVGAYFAYYAFLAIGQGVFPMLFFTGVCLVLLVFKCRLGDVWMRVVGLLLMCIACAAAIHHFTPGTPEGLPEGQGGIVGIAAGHFLHHYFSTIGTRLVLTVTLLVGLVLAADDLLLMLPGKTRLAFAAARDRAPLIREMAHGSPLARLNRIKWNFAPMPKLPALPGFVTRDAIADRFRKLTGRPAGTSEDDADIARLNAASRQLRSSRLRPSVSVAADAVLATMNNEEEDEGDIINLSYRDDDHAPSGADAAFNDETDPEPAEAVVIPLPAPPRPVAVPAPIINNRPTPAQPAGPATASAPVVTDEARDDALDDDDRNDVLPPPSAAMPAAPPLGEAAPVAEPKKPIIVKLPTFLKPRQMAPVQMPKELGEYHLPLWDCLEEAEGGYAESQEQFVREQAAILEQALREFNIDAHVVEIDTGPVITMYEIHLAAGIKVSAISSLSNDIQRALKAESVRIVAPIPGKNTVGIEIPNAQKEKVRFKELMQLAPDSAGKLIMPLYLGKNASGEPLITDLAAMPHCLIAGTTGSGKSVCINTIIMSIMYKQRPDMVKLILVDPKVVEMAPFKDIPHLMCPVINDSAKATSVLEWACEKMDERYEFLAEAGVRNIKGFNTLTQEELIERFQPSSPEEEAKIPKKLPYIIIIIDELADLMMTSGKEVEASIVRLAQKSRAVGIHLILATQRPAATVVTGLIKANMPTRLAFRVQSRMDSRIVLDQNGADLLLGHGDMLFLPPGANKPIRAQGTFIDDKEIRESVKAVRAMAEAQYEPELVQIKSSLNAADMEKDDLFDDAVRVVLETRRGSVSLLQRRLTIGYSRASRLIEQMAAAGIVGDYKGSQAREATLTLEEWDAMKAAQQEDEESGMSV
jgi:DNA segregation ATPase FtsK/SpoIIIE-like protein